MKRGIEDSQVSRINLGKRDGLKILSHSSKIRMRGLSVLVILLFGINFISAAISDDWHLNIQVRDSSGNIVTGTFDFEFNITTASDCSNVVYNNRTRQTTDTRGIVSYYLEDVNLNYTDQYYLCYYRDDVLKSSSQIARVPYAFNSKYLDGASRSAFFPFNTSVTGTFDFNGGWTAGGLSIQGGAIYADTGYFYNLSKLNVTSLNVNGSLLPYAGFDDTFDLGANTLRWRDAWLSRNLNVSGTATIGIIKSYDWTNVTITESQITDLAHTQLTNVAWINQSNVFSVNQNFSNSINLKPLTTPTGTSSQGDVFYNSSLNGLMSYNGSEWLGLTGVPEGSIMAFDDVCPTGWTEYTAGRGRYIVGNPSGGTLGSTVGTALTDSENRAVGQHEHDLRLHISGQESSLYGLQATSGNFGDRVAVDDTVSPGLNYSSATNGSVVGTNAPYIQLTWCQKVGQDSLVSESFWGNVNDLLFVQNTSWNVGIGTTSPTEKLEVVGNVNVTGNITSGGDQIAGMYLIETQTASSSATIDFTTGIDSTYDSYVLVGSLVVPVNDAVAANIQVHSGGVWKTANYQSAVRSHDSDGGLGIVGSNSNGGAVTMANDVGSDVGEGISFTLTLHNPSNTAIYKHIDGSSTWDQSSGNTVHTLFGGSWKAGTGAVDGIRMLFGSGNIESGIFHLYGVK